MEVATTAAPHRLMRVAIGCLFIFEFLVASIGSLVAILSGDAQHAFGWLTGFIGLTGLGAVNGLPWARALMGAFCAVGLVAGLLAGNVVLVVLMAVNTAVLLVLVLAR